MSGVNVMAMLDQYKKDQISAVPGGTYVLEIATAKVRGDNAIMPTFKIVEGPMAGQKVLAGQFTLTEASANIFFQNLRGCGLGMDYFERGPSMEDIAAQLVGRVVQAELRVREWNGEDRNEIPIGKIKFLRMAGPGGIPGAPAPVPAVAAPTPAEQASISAAPVAVAAAPAAPAPAEATAAPVAAAEADRSIAEAAAAAVAAQAPAAVAANGNAAGFETVQPPAAGDGSAPF